MKRFIIKTVAIAAIVVLLTCLINFVFVRNYTLDPEGIHKFKTIPDEIQICNFGSSHGLCGYNYADYGTEYGCFNFGLTSQSLDYDYRLFENYKDKIGEGAIVFINVSYFTLLAEEEQDADFASKNKRYYTILPKDLIKEYDAKTMFFTKYLPALLADRKVLLDTLTGKVKAKENDDWYRVTNQSDAAVDAKAAYGRHFGKSRIDGNGNWDFNQKEIDALCLLIEGCKEIGAVPVLVTTPYLQAYNQEIQSNAQGFYEQFYAILDGIVEKTGAEYYDYAFDSRFVETYDWFMNADHLNAEGARNFVEILMQETVFRKGYTLAK